MTRWWDDPELAQACLGRISSAGHAQVGAAFLGYHGLAAGQLRPLSTQTCVDIAVVRQQLAGVDVDRVAKALGVATSGVMGAASADYGRLLAQYWHEQSCRSATDLLLNLTSQGVDWPTALTRVAGVVGVPSAHLGPVAKRLRVENLRGMPLADTCDRVLMSFAKHVADLEVGDQVAKAGRPRLREFDESEHPRDEEGKFREKREGERARSSRQVRRDRRHARAERQSRRASLSQLVMRLPASSEPERLRLKPVNRDKGERRDRVRRQGRRDDSSGGSALPQGMIDQPPPDAGNKWLGHLRNAPDGMWYTIIDKETANAIVDFDQFSGMWLSRHREEGLVSGPSEMRMQLMTRSGTTRPILPDPTTQVLLVFDGPVAMDYDADGEYSLNQVPVHPAGLFITGGLIDDGEDILDVSARHNLGGVDDVMPNIVVRMVNPDDFTSRQPAVRGTKIHSQDLPFDQDGNPWTVRKSRPRLREFDESDHPRDELGRFRDKASRREIRDRRRARRDRGVAPGPTLRLPSANQSMSLPKLAAVMRQQESSWKSRRDRRDRVRPVERVVERDSREHVQQMRVMSDRGTDISPNLLTMVFHPGDESMVFRVLFRTNELDGQPDDESFFVDADGVSEAVERFSQRANPLSQVADGLHAELKRQVVLNRVPPAEDSVPKNGVHVFDQERYVSPADAFDEADRYAQVRDVRLPRGEFAEGSFEWLPFAWSHNDGTFSPAIRLSDMYEAPVLVMASKDDLAGWAQDPSGYSLEPVSDDPSDSRVLFSQIAEQAAGDEVYEQVAVQENAPDVYVRPFFLRKLP